MIQQAEAANNASIGVTLIILFMFMTVVVLFVWQLLYYRRKEKQREYGYRPVKSETWIEAREKKGRGEFQQKVARRVAISFEHDMFELECGHRWPAVREQQDLYECKECLEAWVKVQPK